MIDFYKVPLYNTHMHYIARQIEQQVLRASRGFPAIILTGPRRCGKTFLLRHLFPNADYRLLEDPDVIASVRADPRGFLEDLRHPAILDEIQNAPELFRYVRTLIDAAPQRAGMWLLTGSQEAPLMRHVTESMAGRAAILQLLPFSFQETGKLDPLLGGFPEVHARPRLAGEYFSSYIQTYLERDIRMAELVRDIPTFRRFMALLASRNGQMLNRTDLAAPLGISVPTASQWVNVLEMTGQIVVVPPYFENFGKRLVKSPKLYFVDSGLLCHLLGIRTRAELTTSVFAGPVFEAMVASEIIKQQAGRAQRRELYYFRDQQGLEIDFVLRDGQQLLFIEAKSTRTPTPAMAKPLLQLDDARVGHKVQRILVHQASRTRTPTPTIAPGVRAMSLEQFLTR